MNLSIKFREYRKEDAKYIETIIRNTWKYDLFCSEKVAKKMARLYLASCLSNQTFTMVSLLDDEPVGIIMAKSIKDYRKSLKYLFPQLIAGINILISNEGRKITSTFDVISDLDKSLLEDRGKNYDGEIAFFAVNEKCRGLGIGKSLFKMALDYFKTVGVNDFYLYTDSSCNYGFYEYQGLERCGEKVFEVPIGVKNEMKFYLYEGSAK